jgi:hypothetical protein
MDQAARLSGIAGIAVLIALTPGRARADDDGPLGRDLAAHAEEYKKELGVHRVRMPISFAEQPLTLPALTLGFDAGFDAGEARETIVLLHRVETLSALSLGARLGITNALEAFATVLPLSISPETQYEAPEIGATFRILSGDIELGATAGLLIPVRSGPFTGDLRVPLLIRIGQARVDTGVAFAVSKQSSAFVPLDFSVNITERFYARLESGLSTGPFSATEVTVPLGLSLHYTFAAFEGPIADLGPSFSFPRFVGPGGVSAEVWQVGATLRAFIYL